VDIENRESSIDIIFPIQEKLNNAGLLPRKGEGIRVKSCQIGKYKHNKEVKIRCEDASVNGPDDVNIHGTRVFIEVDGSKQFLLYFLPSSSEDRSHIRYSDKKVWISTIDGTRRIRIIS